jgi:hypothetical protein
MTLQGGDNLAAVTPDHIDNHRQNEAEQGECKSDCEHETIPPTQ